MVRKVLNWVKSHWKLVTAIVVIALIFGVLRTRAAQPKDTYTIVHPQKQTIEQQLEVSGVVDASQRASLKFLAGGKVVYVGAKQGDAVKKWQTIATIDRAQLQKTLQQNLNAYSATRIDFDQKIDDEKDVNGNKIVDRELQKNELSLQNSVLSVELQSIALKNTSLYTPIDGILVSAPAKTAGVILSPTDVFEIIDPKTIYFEALVDEADIRLVREGQSVKITLDAYPDEPIETTIEYISFTSSESDSGTVFKVRMSIPVANDALKYKIGMNGTARVLVNKTNDVLSVPITTLIQRDGKTYVEVLKNGKDFEQREIQTGIENETEIEVTSGLSESDEVVQR